VFNKEFREGLIVTGIICLCTGLFSMAHYMGWLAQDSSLLGTLDRNIYGPDIRQEMNRLKQVKETTPDVPRITTLCYHEVEPGRAWDPLNVSPEVFRCHIREFKEAGYTFIGVSDLRKHMLGMAKLPEKSVLISFDDGYADNYAYAYPILREEKVPGTFFVVSGTVGHDNRMTVDALREMQANGMDIGSHTVNHENLSEMDETDIDYEMRESKAALEKMLGKPVFALAYPEGKADEAVLESVKKYYDMAFLASVSPENKQTMYTLQRYGVFSWNEHIESIFRNK